MRLIWYDWIMKNVFNRGIAPVAIILIVAAVLALAGGGWYLYQKVKIPAHNASISDAGGKNQNIKNSVAQDETAGWKTYRNEKYGFQIKYPDNHTAWKSIDQKKEVLIPAGIDSEFIGITEMEKQLFCCEPVTLGITVENGDNARNWIDKNYQKYTSREEIQSIKDVTFAGQGAVEM